MKYNQLTILEEVFHKQRWMFKTQCDCGNIEIKRKDWVTSGRTTSCKSCASKRTAKNYPPPRNFQGIGGLSKTHYSHIKTGAEKRNLVFDVTLDFLWQLYEDQGGYCALTGLPIILVPSIKNHNANWDLITASLDRINSSLGYVVGNVWWVHKEVNRLKNNYSMSDLLYWCKLIVDTHGNPDPSVVNANEVATKEQRLDGEEATNNPSTSAQHPTNYPIQYDMLLENWDEDIV